MHSWNYGEPHFIMLRDKDGADCKVLKARLQSHASKAGKPFHIRIVCEQLESWFLGDLAAIEAAFPRTLATRFSGAAKYRNPDLLTNASDELARFTGVFGKVSKATAIAPHLELDRNKSPSFQLVCRTLSSLFS
jgi:hypothetical protein